MPPETPTALDRPETSWLKLHWPKLQPYLSTLVRVGIPVVALWAAIPKLTDIGASQRSVAAYQVMPWELSQIAGVALPVIELTLGLLALAGLLTRPTAIIFGLLMVVFIVGIAQAWARGLDIDCGCFGPGGQRPPGSPPPPYLQEILRDVGFLAMATFVTIWPRSRFSADKALKLEPAARPK